MKINIQKLALLLIAAFTSLISFSQTPGTVKSFSKISIAPTSLGDNGNWNLMGNSFCFLNDIDGDGNKELVVSSTLSVTTGPGPVVGPHIYVLKLGSNNQPKTGFTRMGENEGNVNLPGTSYSDFGLCLTNIGDLNGNGVDEIVTGCPENNYFATIYMNSAGLADSIVKVTFGTNGYNESGFSGSAFGGTVACIGDLDHDGINDLAVGNTGDLSNKGSITIFFMNANGRVKSYIKLANSNNGFPAIDPGKTLGRGIANLGDLDRDGNNDLLVGAPGIFNADGGEAYTLFMNANGTVKSYYKYKPGTSSFSYPTDISDWFGHTTANIGDINGDTITDVAISAPLFDTLGASRGRVYIMLLNRDGSAKGYQIIDGFYGGLSGQLDTQDDFGIGLLGGFNDVNGDHIYDLLVSAPKDDGPTPGDNGRDAGAIYFLNLDGIPVTTSVGDVITNTDRGLSVYPNPTAADLTIRTKNNELIKELSIFDALGKRVQHIVVKSSSITFNVSSLPAGQYYIKVGSATGIATVQLLKK